MVVLFVICTLFLMVLFDMFVIWPIQQSRKSLTYKQKEKVKPEFFESDLGITMADGGELIDDEEKKV